MLSAKIWVPPHSAIANKIGFGCIPRSVSEYSTFGGTDLQANKDIALGLSIALMNGEWDKAADLISDDFTYEVDGRPSIDKASYLGFMQGVLTLAFTDMDMNFLHVVAEGDLVAIDYANAMTNSGDFLELGWNDGANYWLA